MAITEQQAGGAAAVGADVAAAAVAAVAATQRMTIIRPMMLRALRKGGRVSIPGVYGGYLDKFPLGAMMEKGAEIRTGQTPSSAIPTFCCKRSPLASSIRRF
jgi:threonine dehydrogenase-like Zn-dependent dehydrogenase